MDDIFEKLDQLEENGDYKGMVELLKSLPEEQRTLELAFTLISALINAEDYRGAVTQLRGIFPACKETSELAQVFYYSGYAVTQLGGNPVLGLSLLKEALVNDPKEELGLDIEQECRDCVDKINIELAKFRGLCGKAAQVIRKKSAEAKGGTVLEGRELLAKLSFLNIFRRVPVLEEPLGDIPNIVPLEGEKREKFAEWLSAAIGIGDYESLVKSFEESRNFNISLMTDNALSFIRGKPDFDPDVLDPRSRDAFDIFVLMVRCFEEYLPSAGVLGWDIAKRTAVVRFAFLAGMITEEEYTRLTDELLTAAGNFRDPADFLQSLLYGSALAAYNAQNSSISAACNAIDLTMDEIVKCELFGSTFLID